MTFIRKIGTLTSLATLPYLTGCPDNVPADDLKEKDAKYFAEIRSSASNRGIGITSSDFDGDGDNDIIVGLRSRNSGMVRLFFYKNDGQGNFFQD
jgi:hypothetical protein